MHYLITGGAGFIGSHLAEECLRRGHRVTVVDDLSTGSINNIAHLKGVAGFRYFIETIMNVPLMAELVDECDVVLHMAAAVGVRLIVEDPVRTITTNIRGTEVVLELAAKKGKLVLVASTSEVYGKSEREKFSEEDDLVLGSTSRSRWSYAASKIVDEFLALAYAKEQKLPVITVRFFNIVGPRQTGRYGMVVPRFVRQALTGQSITVYGDGRQTRTFTHVKDAVEAVMRLIEYERAAGNVFNIGGLEEISIADLAHLVKTELKSSSEITFIPYDKVFGDGFEDMRRRVPNIEKIRRLIGYTPRYTLRDIIHDVAEYERGVMVGDIM